MTRLVVRVPNWLGDLVMSLEALAGLSSEYQRICFWAHPRIADLLPVFFPGAATIALPRAPSSRDFDSLLLLTDSLGSAMAGFRTGIRERAGHGCQFRSLLLTRRIRKLRGRGHHHSIDYARLARMLGAEPAGVPAPVVEPSGAAHTALFPGARYGPAKHWPGFEELGRALASSGRGPVVLYGSSDEIELLESLAARIPGASTSCGLDLPDLCSRLMSARLAIGNDSGGIHLAAALGLPSVAVFGSTSPEWTAPRGSRARVVASSAPCAPCFRRKCPKSPVRCFEAVTVEMILEAAESASSTVD